MLIGFIVVIVMILIIVGLMAIGNEGGGDTGLYSTQIKKLKTFINNVESEAVLYHGMNNNFNGFNAKYLNSVKIGTELYSDNVADTATPMTKANWLGLPSDFDCDGVAEANNVNYMGAGRGVFLFKGYIPGNQKAMIVHSCNTESETFSKIIIVKERTSTYETLFDEMLEMELSNYGNFYGA